MTDEAPKAPSGAAVGRFTALLAAVPAALSALGKITVAAAIILLQWAKIKQRKAEDKIAILESDERIEDGQAAIEAKKTDSAAADVDAFLAESKK